MTVTMQSIARLPIYGMILTMILIRLRSSGKAVKVRKLLIILIDLITEILESDKVKVIQEVITILKSNKFH